MPEWFFGALLVALIVAGGVLAVRLFLARGAMLHPSQLFAGLALGLIVTGWLALVLAELNLFALGRLLAMLAVAVVVLLLWAWRRRGGDSPAPPAPEAPLARWEWVMLAVWLAVAAWLFFRPHEYVYGGADAGVYVSLGAEIAHNGGFRIDDGTLAGLSPEMRAAVLRPLPDTPGASAYLLPGFYVSDDDAGRLIPQFYPQHPVWQAVAFAVAGGEEVGDAAAGIDAQLLLTGLWMVLGTLAVYLTARDLGGPVVGALALAGLSLSALQVWFGRYPTSEALTQFLLWVGVWSGGRWLGDCTPTRLWAFLAGCALGAVFLTRIDALVLLPVFALVLVWRWARGWAPPDNWFAIPFVALVVQSLLHGHFLSGPYFYETVGYGLFLLTRLWPLLLVAILLGGAGLWWLARRAGRPAAPARWRRPILGGLVAALLLYALYGWFLRPILPAVLARPDFFSGGQIPVTNHENWLRLGWYLSPLGVWLGVLGGCLLLWRVERPTLLVVAIGWLFAVIYLWNISANPHHVYVMRRYAPVVAPFFILGAAYLLGHWPLDRAGWAGYGARAGRRLAYPLGPVLLAMTAVVWLAGLGWSARGFVSQVDHAGLTAQLDELAGRLPDGTVLLFNDQSPVGQGDVWGTPLRFIYGHDALALRQPPATVAAPLVESIKTWQNSGRPVVWVGDSAWLDEAQIAYRTEQITLQSERLESSYDHKPTAIWVETVLLTLNYLQAE